MKHVILVAVLAIGTSLAIAQTKPAEQPAQTPQMSAEQMMEEGMKLAAPGEQHQRLAKREGRWNVTGQFIMPGAPPMKFTGTQDAKMILGGRFLRIEGKAQSAQPGLESESLTVLGFDKRTSKYTLWSVDTYGTYSISATGDYDEAAQAVTYVGENEEPDMGKVPFKFVIKHVDDAHYTLELHMQFPGMGWHKMMEATHERE
jgi:hypothetical protein